MDLREAIKARGLSARAVARMLNYDHAYLSRVLSGKQVPSAQLMGALEALLGVPLTEPTPESLGKALQVLRRAEDVSGPEKVRATTLAQARVMTRLADDATGPDRRAVVGLAGEWTNYAGWIELESGCDERARRWFNRAAEYAAEADDPTLESHVFSFRGYAAGRTGNLWANEGLTGAARRVRGVHPGQETYNDFQYARVLARMGESGKAGRLLDTAVSRIDRAAAEDPPPFAYWYSHPFFTMNAGLTHAVLGHVAMATDLIHDGIANMPLDQQGAQWVDEFTDALRDEHLA